MDNYYILKMDSEDTRNGHPDIDCPITKTPGIDNYYSLECNFYFYTSKHVINRDESTKQSYRIINV